jgi:nicotinamidase-related amidase
MSELNLEYAALLMIDVQREYFAERSPLRIPDGPLVLGKLRTLVETCRETDLLPVIHIRHEEAPGAPVFAVDGPLVETMPEVAPRGVEPTIVKHSPGAFTKTELGAVLSQLNIGCLVIGGFMTHMCCDTTARQAQERGLDVVFLTDGTATRDLAYGDNVVSHREVQEATLAAQADGFSTLSDVTAVRTWLHG